MDGLVKLSFYCFTAASIALAGSAISYLVYAIGRIRVRRAVLATSAGTTMTATSAQWLPGSVGASRFASLLGWFAVFFQGMAVLLRTIAAERGPYSNMYEFSLAFIFVLMTIYLVFERMY